MLFVSFLLMILVPIELQAASTEDFVQQESAWRKLRLERLTSEEGWLTLVGLHWLKPGENEVRGLVFTRNENQVRVRGGEGLKRNGEPMVEGVLKSDSEASPDRLEFGGLRMFLIQRGERLGIRVKDPESAVRKNFRGLEYFPPSETYQVIGMFVPYPSPKKVRIPTVLDTLEEMTSPGVVKFTLHEKEFSLEPYLEDEKSSELFFIFKDGTSGKETYPAGRYFYSEMPKNGKIEINFNRAYNPPCAFTHYATCPLPPAQNFLPVRIEAGEKTYRPSSY